MKRLQLLTVFLMLSTLSFGQNRSITPVLDPITLDPILGSQEIFRFQPGLVTQLGAGSTGFGFNQKWFSIGELNTASQMVYGLRFQLPNKSLTMGYQDTNDTNPRIQWIGTGQNLGNLEFRVANSFTSTSSDFVTSFNRDGTVNIGSFNTQLLGQAQVKINSTLESGLFIRLQNSNNNTNFGVFSDVSGANQSGFGLFGFVTNSQFANFGVAGRNSGTSPQEYAIYGIGTPFGGQSQNNFAGFFDGDLSFTADFFQSSDDKLKENVETINSALESLMKLEPKTYDFIQSDKINLSQRKQYGFIAQELEKVFPELTKDIKKPVFDKKNNVTEFFEYKSVNYLGLIAILTASIQELTAEVNQLKENKETYVVYEAAFTQEELAKIAQNGYRLKQNYPNPFQGRSSIAYALPEAENNASIMIFDMTGKTIKEYPLKEKQGQIQIDSQDFRPGIYLYSLIGNNKEIITKRMIVK